MWILVRYVYHYIGTYAANLGPGNQHIYQSSMWRAASCVSRIWWDSILASEENECSQSLWPSGMSFESQKIKTHDTHPTPVFGPLRIQNTSTGTRKGCSWILLILAVENPSFPDALLMKTFETTHQSASFTISSKTLVLNSGVHPELQ